MSDGQPQWMIYGANGYTGKLIAREAVQRGLAPVLAGRNREEVEALGRELSLPVRVFACVSADEIASNLARVGTVLHCAGPFSATSKPMTEACLRAKAHYLDISGEIPVFERIHGAFTRYRDAGIVAMPGVGFDVVPSDCLAAMLKRDLPDATKLVMGLKIGANASPGTTKTMIEGLHAGAVVRRDGNLVRIPAASLLKKIRFRKDREEDLCVIFPWGDVSTAFYSTAIPDIEFYARSNPGMIRLMKASRYLKPLLARRSVQALLKKAVDQWIAGPDTQMRDKAPYYLWGEARNDAGKRVQRRMKTPNGYSLTVDSAIHATLRVHAGKVKPGAWTPSKAFGPDFVLELQGVEVEEG